VKNPPANPRAMQTSVARRAAGAHAAVLMSVNAHGLSATVRSSISNSSTRLASMPIHPHFPESWWPVKKPAPAPPVGRDLAGRACHLGPRSGVDVVERETRRGDFVRPDIDKRGAGHWQAEDADILADVMARHTAAAKSFARREVGRHAARHR
jgi:hypothetical protein